MRNIEAGPGRPSKNLENRRYQMQQRKGGFPIDIENCKSILAMAKDPEWKELAAMVAKRIEMIHTAYQKAGLIGKRGGE